MSDEPFHPHHKGGLAAFRLRDGFGNDAHLCLAPGTDNDADASSGGDGRSGKNHVFAIAYTGVSGQGVGLLDGRDGFAGQKTFIRGQVFRLDKAKIGRRLVSGFQDDDIAGHNLL
jgi:hypothetical protein